MALDAGKVVAILELDTSKFSGGLKTAQAMIADVGDKSLTAQDRIKAIGTTMQSVGKVASAALTLPILGAGIAAVKSAGDFDKAMKGLQAILQATGEEMEPIIELAKDIGSTTTYSAAEATAAMKYFAVAGDDATKIMETMRGVLALAEGSSLDLATTSEIVADNMSAFGMKASQTDHFVNVLAGTTSAANVEVNQLGEALKYAAPSAAVLGYTIDDVAVALGIMANSGIKGSQAGTTLQNVFSKLANPTKEGAKLLKEMGIQITNADGSAKPFATTLDEMREAFAKLGPEQQLLAAKQIVGQQAAAGFLSVINETAENLTDMREAIYGAQDAFDGMGAAYGMQATATNNLNDQLKILKNALGVVAIDFGEVIMPHLMGFVDMLKGAVEWLRNLSPEMLTTIVNIAGLVAAIGPALMIGGKLIAMFSFLAGPAGWVMLTVAAIAALTVAWNNYSKASSNALEKSLANVNQDELRAVREAFGEIDTTIRPRVTVEGDPNKLVTDAVADFKAALQGITILTDEERDRIVGLLGEQVDPIFKLLMGAGFDLTGADPNATAAASQITAAAIALNEEITGLSQYFGDGEADLIAELINADKETIVAALTERGATEAEANAAADQIIARRNGLRMAVSQAWTGDESALANARAGLVEGDIKTVIKALTDAGVDEETAKSAAADAIKKCKTDLDGAVKDLENLLGETVISGITTSLGTGKSNLVEALSGLGLSDDEIAEIVSPITQIQAKLKAEADSIYDNIYALLTDGKPDTAEQTQQLKADVQAYIDELMEGVDLSTEKGQEYAAALQELQATSFAYIETMSGKSKTEVEKSMADLRALSEEAARLKGDILGYTVEAGRSNEDINVRMVKAGVTTSEEKVAKAFEATYQDYGANVYDIQQKAAKAREEADKAWNEAWNASKKIDNEAEKQAFREAAQETYNAQLSAIEETAAAATEKAQAEYQKNINELFAGLALALPEAAEQLGSAMDQAMQQNVLRKLYDESEFSSQEADTLLKALLPLDGNTDWESLIDSYLAGNLDNNVADYLRNGLYEAMRKQMDDPTGQINYEGGGLLSAYLESLLNNEDLAGGLSYDTNNATNQIMQMLGMIPIAETVQGAIEPEYAAGFLAAQGGVAGAAGELLDAAIGELDGATEAETAGANTAEGYRLGALSKVGAMETAGRALARALMGAFNSEAGIKSPSVKARRSGVFMGEGYVLGMMDKLPNVLDMGKQLGSAGVRGMEMAKATFGLSADMAAGGGQMAPAMAGAGDGGTPMPNLTINLPNAQIRDDGDIRKLSRLLGKQIAAFNGGQHR